MAADDPAWPAATCRLVLCLPGETQYMVFVRFLPENVTEEALDELIPGSISVDIATNFKGEYRE